MKRITSLLLIAAMLLGTLSGCVVADNSAYVPTGNALVMEGQDPNSVNPTEEAEPQELVMVYYPEKSLNPLTSNDYTNRVLFSLVYQGLFSVDSDYEASPMLCQTYRVSPDNRTWTFYITRATFSDGSLLTIQDVMASFEAAKKSRYYSGRFLHVREFAISDDGGIVFKMDTPYEDLPLLLDIPIVKADEVDAEVPLGTGPYSLEDSLTGAHLRRVLNWWCDAQVAATADSIPLIVAQSPSQIRDEFEFNDVGLVCADPYSDNYADFRGDYELWEIDSGTFLFLACNVSYSKDDIFKEPTLRAALTYAIDRDSLVENNYNGFAKAATLAASPSLPYYSTTLAEKYSYDPMKFLSAVNSYGLVKNTVRLLVNKDDLMRLRTARNIAETFTELGLPTETVEVSTNTYLQYINVGNYDLYLGQTKLSANMDLSAFFGPWANISYNGISDTVLYNLSLDALADHGNYYNLHKTLAEDGRIIPILFAGYAVFADRGLLSNLSPSRDNVFHYTRSWTMADAKLETIYED